jgi:tetratricopeptide (TPR) repeat protein
MGKNVRQVNLYAESYYPNQNFGWSPLRALISDRFKYVLAPTPELYDLGADFAERRNLAHENRALAGQMEEQLRALISQFSAGARPVADHQPDAETLERLQSLGYVALAPSRAEVLDVDSLPDPKDQIGVYNRIAELFELSQQERHDETIKGYREILGEQPQLKIVRYKLGQAYFHTGNYAAALKQFKKTIELGGDSALAVFALSQTYMRLKQSDEAIVGFEQTLKLDPGHYRARINLGVLYKNQGKLPEAIAQLEEAIKLAPDSVMALSNLGVSYSLVGEHGRSIELLKRAVDLEPSNAVLHANLGLAYRKNGQEVLAKAALDKARTLNPSLFQRP